MKTVAITAGVLIRKTVRRYLMQHNLKYKEDKGFSDSLFIVYYNEDEVKEISQLLNRLEQYINNP